MFLVKESVFFGGLLIMYTNSKPVSLNSASPPPYVRREVIPRQIGILAWISLAFAAILASIYPFIRKVDDLFNISTELAIVTVAVILLARKLQTHRKSQLAACFSARPGGNEMREIAVC